MNVPSPLARAVGDIAGRRDRLDDKCRALLEELRKRCPDLAPDRRWKAGEVGPEIPVDPKQGQALFPLVARRVAGLPTDDDSDPGVVVWAHEGSELAVFADKVRVTTADGAVAVDLAVRCDEVGDATVRVRFALGSDGRPAGMVAATDERPFGPADVVDVWGEALTAYAWQIVLSTGTALTDAAGRDEDGAGLVPVAVRATRDGLAVLAMARHAFDRRESP